MKRSASSHLRRPRARQRGSVLVLVLGVTSIVGVIGLSALLAVRLQHADVRDRADAVAAQHLADGALQLVHTRLNQDSAWRTNHTHDTWTDAEVIGKDSFLRYKLIDQEDTDLADNTEDPLRLLIRVKHGDAVRLVSQSFTGTSPSPVRGSYRRELDE